MDIRPRQPRDLPGVTRRQDRQPIGDVRRTRRMDQRPVNPGGESGGLPAGSQEPFVLDTSDIDDTVETAKVSAVSRFGPRRLLRRIKARFTRRRAKLVFGVLLIAAAGWFGIKLFLTAQSIIDRNGGALALQDNIDPSQLNGEGDGRVNILLIGIGGNGHEGGTLADTIMVASIDPFNNEVAMLSVPRDLWVDVPGKWTQKINAAHALGEQDGFSESGFPDGGPGLLQKTVEQTLGIPIHYYLRVDFQGFKQAVDAVGSITVDVPEAICDYHIAWEFGFSCIQAGKQEFDSNKALFYARTRASTRGDLDRGERQRLLVLGLRDKVLSVGTFANPFKVLDLMSAAKGRIKTNLSSANDLKRLYEIGEQISPDKIISAGLDDYVTTGNVNGASVVLPKDPSFEEIKKYVRSIFIDGFIKKEAARIDVLNGTPVAGLATSVHDELASYGYMVGDVGNAPGASDYATTILYDLSGGQAPFTKRLLEQRLDVTATDGGQLPSGIESQAKFVIIVGANAEG